ncbi:hypothetical protein EXS74_00180 [Candidatus Woesearchaeota archaeon]|nr:hypothetical protein [Candidatus Woesearchaeota archaeon]
MPGERKSVKCEGRFPELREYLFGTPVDMVLGERKTVSAKDLDDLWSLIKGDIYQHDLKDPYFMSHCDLARKQPELHPYALVPLFPSPDYILAVQLVQLYTMSLGVSFTVSEKMEGMARLPERFLLEELKLEPRLIEFPNRATLSGYDLHTHFGIGTISLGGVEGSGIRSDSPHLIEIYRKEGRGQRNLAGVVGFLVQDEDMLISQIQACRNAALPSGVPLGVGSIITAEHIAKTLGFKRMKIYTARGHPHFKKDPNSWRRMGKEFIEIFDTSVKKIGGYKGDGEKDQVFTKTL